MKKRSSHVALLIVGAAAVALSGCTENEVDVQAFPDLATCKAESARTGAFSSADCEAAFNEGMTLHVESAPRYDSLATCEEEHGQGACGSEEQVTSGGSGSIFMPLLAGMLIGNMLGGGRSAQPLYRTPDGRFTNATGTSVFSSNTGKGKVSASQFTKPPSTIGKPPMSKATAKSRGGFGGTGRSVGGGFGG